MKSLAAGIILASASSLVMAGTGPGCGLGSMVFKGKSGIPSHVLAATTNGSFGNQTFGMTTGSLGCDANGTITSTAMYMDSNMDNIAMDISRGEGENLETLAVLLKVEQADRAAFRLLLKQNFQAIFPSSKTTSDEAFDQIVAILKSDEKMSKYVS